MGEIPNGIALFTPIRVTLSLAKRHLREETFALCHDMIANVAMAPGNPSLLEDTNPILHDTIHG